ncbi:Hypothetical protein Bdt_3507 [Bdellovibrio bacteriovorus str. Tiberius]|uniref:Uncharacterized protein n=1 Tax=Bdellovibrio bacteriovorus str. Tiberius TaxID=1069642 RepID=K7ZH70_BDEBC|nr:Hypothetical protein Bdt_3507 [Bdellovibrio bacteriovorus str. Tiberius]
MSSDDTSAFAFQAVVANARAVRTFLNLKFMDPPSSMKVHYSLTDRIKILK